MRGLWLAQGALIAAVLLPSWDRDEGCRPQAGERVSRPWAQRQVSVSLKGQRLGFCGFTNFAMERMLRSKDRV